MKTLGNILLLATLFIISSCKKESDLPDAGGDILDKVISAQTGTQLQFITKYNYDVQNRLQEMVIGYLDSSNYLTKINLSYNGSGQLEGYSYNSFKDGDQCTVSFIYDGEGHIVKKQFNIIDADYHADDCTFTYDASGHIIADTFRLGQTNEIRGYHTYTYDANGNITLEQYFNDENHDGQFEFKSQQEVGYNANISPFLPMAVPLYMIENSWLYLSTNNPVFEDYFNFYTYYSNGLIKRLVTAVPNDPNTLITEDFYYK